MLKHVESIVLFVPDVAAAARWYAEIFGSEIGWENPQYAFVRAPGVTIGFHPADSKCPGGVGGTTVYWEVDSLAEAIRFLVDRGAILYRGPAVTSFGAGAAMLRDPFGSTIGLNVSTSASRAKVNDVGQHIHPVSVAPPALPGYVVSRIAISDVMDWFEFAVLPEMQRYTSSIVSAPEDLSAVVRRTEAPDSNAPVLFAVREPTAGRLVGVFGFHTVSSLNRTAEITYAVRPESSGQGLASEMCRAATEWAFRAKGWVRVQATTLEANVASQRVLQKCGFLLEGRLRNFRLVRGEPHDYLVFSRVPERSGAA